jgi:pimeloyl-ACP methyl ester carboxylesterase
MGLDVPIADAEGLHPVANTEKDPRAADIVFVHGLGFSHSTWRYGQVGDAAHFFWPAALGEDLPQCGIWTVGYPAGITVVGKPGMIIDKRAGNLSQKLANAGLGTRPLFFITHSMGGLVVKSLIVDSQTLADADRKRLVSVVRGIVFLGTPHRGSAFADAARVLSAFLGGSQEHVDEMRANADPLDILHDEFIEWHRKNPVSVESYAENIGLFRTRRFLPRLPLGLVVPRASANPGIAGHTVRDVDHDHLTLVKPQDRKQDVYAGVLRFVRNALASKSLQDLAVTPVSRLSGVMVTDDEAESGAAGVIGRPRVYLSYTLRTKDLRDRVFGLAERLRRNGIDSRMDLFYARSLHGFTPPDPVPQQDSWALWQEEQVQQADRVLILCSKEFNESPDGSGAWFDVELMKRDVESGAELRKFIPVGFGDYESNRLFIPSFIFGATYYDLTPGPIAGFGFEDLLRRFRTEFSSTSAAGGLGRVNRTTSTLQAQPPPSVPDASNRAHSLPASGNYDPALETRTPSLTPGDTRESVVLATSFRPRTPGRTARTASGAATVSASCSRRLEACSERARD